MDVEKKAKLLIASLGDENPRAREDAAWELGDLVVTTGRYGCERAIEPLIGALRDDDARVRGSAARSLGEICTKGGRPSGSVRKKAVEPLISTLRDNDARVRALAAWTLGEIDELRAVFELIYYLKDDSPLVRHNAAEAIGKTSGTLWFRDDAAGPLIEALKDDDASVRLAAALALRRIRIGGFPDLSKHAFGPLNDALDEAITGKKEFIQALGEIGDERAIEPLIAMLDDGDPIARWEAASSLQSISYDTPNSVERPLIALLPLLDDDDEWVRDVAASGIGNIWRFRKISETRHEVIGSEEFVSDVVESLIGCLSDDEWEVRNSAAKTLTRIGDSRGIEHLISNLSHDDAEMRSTASWNLGDFGWYRGDFGDERLVEPLITALYDDGFQVREGAAISLVSLSRSGVSLDSAVEPLISVLDDDCRNARQAVIKALGEIGDERATEPLIAVLDDDTIQDCWRTRGDAMDALAKIGDKLGVETLIDMLSSDVTRDRVSSARALGNVDGEHQVKPLISSLRFDEDDWVRRLAAESLGKIGGEYAVDALTIASQIDEDEWVRIESSKALKLIISRLNKEKNEEAGGTL